MSDWLLAISEAAELLGVSVSMLLIGMRLGDWRNKSRGRRLNRIFNNFTYSRLVEAIVREAEQQGIAVKQVNPAFSSVIGGLKYRQVYAHFAVHEAAAYVLSRRGLGFIDMPTGSQRKLAMEATEARRSKGKLHHRVFWRSLNSGTNSASKESSGTIGEPKQGTAPTCFDGENPSRYRGKGTGGESKKGGGSSRPPVQPGSSASREGCAQTL